MTIFIASAFSKNKMGGNKAGVCLYGDKLEYFTPAEEVPLCGHATIASFVVMRDKSMLGKNEYTIETKSGSVSVILDSTMVFMKQSKPLFYETLSKR